MGYIIYQENQPILTVNDPFIFATDLDVYLETGQQNSFTITAYNNLGNESNPSPPYIVDVPQEESSGNIPPVAHIEISSLSGPAPHNVDVSASTSIDYDGVIISYAWNFGDGGFSINDNEFHTYDIPGSYTVILEVTDDTGSISTTETTVTVTDPQIIPNEPPTPLIYTTTNSGPSPLDVLFDGTDSTDSDGTIVDYSWDFGDGSSGNGSFTNYTYTAIGTFTGELTVTDDGGASASDQTVLSVTASDLFNNPPVASINASPLTGTAPLTTTFSGADSTDSEGVIISYDWDFGDGAVATGVSSSHIFSIAGTYTTTLTVTDGEGLTNSIGTPIIVTIPQLIENLPPQAIFSATPTSGNAPLTVTFNASESTDPDGTINNYTWQFGDDSSGSGVTATHTYTNLATFTATLLVTDNDAAQSSANTAITVNSATITPDFNIEFGEISINSNWSRVEITTPFKNPIVIAGPPTSTDSEPCVVRLQNISPTGFDIKLDEWDYLDNSHGNENVNYIVMEKGRFTLADGTQVEAGSLGGTTSFKPFTFSKPFNLDPVVISTIASNNEPDTISGRIHNTSKSGFEYYFREQEKNSNTHVTETINFIAWEQSTGTMGTLIYEVQATPSSVTHSLYDIAFQSHFTTQPLVLADIQTTNGADTSATRLENPTTAGIQVKIEEEQSKDDEVSHIAEVVGYVAIGSVEKAAIEPSQGEKQFTFTWEYDTEAQDVSSFRFYLNNTLLCETNTQTDRTHSCTASLLAEVMSFTMTAVDSSGTETIPSNLLTFDPTQFLQLATTRKASFTWEFDQAAETDIIGFALAVNNRIICETNDPTARQLTCEIDTPLGETLFSIQAIKSDNTTTSSSNVLSYTP